MSTNYYSTFHPAESSGAKGSAAFAGSALNTALIYLYRRSATALTASDKPNAVTTYTFDPPSISLTGVTNGWTSTIPAGSDPLYAVTITVASDTPTVTIDTAEWATPVVLAQNGANGVAGSNTAIVYLYQRAATTPTAPSGTFTYTFATGVLSGGTPGSWTQAIPATNGNPLWVIAATASSNTATDTIAAAEFSSPVTLVADGTNGTNGLNSATVFLYQRAATAPAVPSTTLTYTFATGVLTGTLGSWTQAIPTGTDPLYVTTATAVSTAATDSILTSEWATVRVLAQNGANGIAGTNSAIVYLYQRAATQPTVSPTGTFTYTFATGALSGGTLGLWSTSIPTSNGNPLWVIAASAISNTATDTIPAAEFSSAVALAADGAAGTAGFNSATVFLYQRSTTAPAVPTTDTTYTFVTSTLSGTLGGWTQTIPAGTNPLYVTTATAVSNSATDTIPSGEWAAVRILSQNGTNGTNGVNSATVFLYQRATSAPAVPNTDLTYTFATGILTGTLGSWTQSVPVGTNPLYVTTATASSTASTDTISTAEWATVRVLSQNGTNGTNAISGYLTKEALSIFTYANGSATADSFTNANGIFRVFNGIDELTTTADVTYSIVGTPTNCTIQLNTALNTPVSGQQKGYYRVTALTGDNASATLRATVTSVTPNVVIDKPLSISRSKGGYEIVGSLPTDPDARRFQGNVVFLTTDNKLYRFDGTNWTTAVPAPDIAGQIDSFQIANNAIVADKLSSSAVTEAKLAVGAVTNEKIVTGAVTTSKLLVVPAGYSPDPMFFDASYWNGPDRNERGPIVIKLYARGISAPTRPTAATYRFDTNVIANTGSWLSTVPVGAGTGTGSDTLWVIAASAYSLQQRFDTEAENTYTFAQAEWGTAIADTTNTGNGTSATTLRIYARNNSTTIAPTGPTTTGTYNFFTGVLTNIGTTWTLAVPGWTDVNPRLWVRHATAHALTTTNPTTGVNTTVDSNIVTTEWRTASRGESGAWYLEENSTISNAMGVPRMYAMWEGVRGNTGHRLHVYSDVERFSGRGQQLRLRANTWNSSNQNLEVAVQFLDAALSSVVAGGVVVSTASSGYSIQSTIITIPSNIVIGGYRFVIYNFGGATFEGAMSVSDIKLDTAAGAELIVDGAITTNKIQANAINADKIQAGAITTSKLLIGDMSILNRNSDFEDGDINWTKEGTWSIVNEPSNARTGSWVGKITGASAGAFRSHVIPCRAGEAFTCDGWLKTSGTGTYTSYYVRISGINSVGSEIWTQEGTTYTGINTSYVRSSGTFTVPVNVVNIRVEVVANIGAGATVWADNIRMLRAATGELIVDGAITAGKISTNAVTADKIEAGAITAAKINVTSLSAINANVGTLTAGSIQNAVTNPTFRVDVTNGRTIVQTGAFMKVSGAPFGSSNQFIEWYGPYFANLSSCTEANATYYLKTNGSAYFGGTLSAGVLKNAAQTTDINTTASVTVGPFSTNGGTKTITLSYEYQKEYSCANGTGSITGSRSITIVVEKSTNGGSTWSTIATLTPSETLRSVIYDPGDPGALDLVQYMVAGSTTATDNTAAGTMLLRGRITSRVLPTFGGTPFGTPFEVQTVGVISIE